jgi:hypothetical protein
LFLSNPVRYFPKWESRTRSKIFSNINQ